MAQFLLCIKLSSTFSIVSSVTFFGGLLESSFGNGALVGRDPLCGNGTSGLLCGVASTVVKAGEGTVLGWRASGGRDNYGLEWIM